MSRPILGFAIAVGDADHISLRLISNIVFFMSLVRMPVRSYRDLVAWQKAMELVVSVYTCTQSFQKTETYGVVSQLRRSAVSVPSNIAEGHARISTGEFRDPHIGAPGYLDSERSNELLGRTNELGRIVNGLLRSLPRRT